MSVAFPEDTALDHFLIGWLIVMIVAAGISLSHSPSVPSAKAFATTAAPEPRTVCWIDRPRLPVSIKYIFVPDANGEPIQNQAGKGIGYTHAERPEAPVECHFTSTPHVPSMIVVETEELYLDYSVCHEDDTYPRPCISCFVDEQYIKRRWEYADNLVRRRPENPATGLPASLDLFNDTWWAGPYRRVATRYVLAADPVATRWVFRVGASQ